VRPDEGPFTIPFADLHQCNGGVHGLRPGKPPEGWLDGGEGNEGGQGFGKVLEVIGETPVSGAWEFYLLVSEAERHKNS
jgi:hypothetical protein